MSTAAVPSGEPSHKSVTMSTSTGESSPSPWVLLHSYAQIGEIRNNTTAHGSTSNNKEIFVSFVGEPPAVPSNLYVDCPVGILRHPPRLLSMVDDLILFHVYVGPEYTPPRFRMCDFFVYRAGGPKRRPLLKLLPHPRGRFYKVHQVGIVPRDDADDRYTIAALVPADMPNTFLFHLLDSDSEDWTSMALHVETPQMDFPLKIPMELNHLMYHQTSSVITLGGGTVGWVDLYRGIIFCDMLGLGDKLTLRGVPVPLPLKQIQPSDPSCRVLPNARYRRGISFVNGCLRFVDLEFDVIQLGGHDQETRWPSSRTESWTITTWSNEKLTTSFDDWHKDCTLRASDIAVGDCTESELPLSTLLDGSRGEEDKLEQRGLQNLFVSDPCFGMNASDGDGDIVYLTARLKFLHPKSWVLAIDIKNQRVHSVVKSGPLPTGTPPIDATYCTCSIAKVPSNNTPAGGTSNLEESGGLGVN